ncbi:hypothetical protein B4113_1101 [Geobacillus sp. B4113_201601]|nr:hypothetical protein B4113_1101 [Geobacillus sp. B4113_201601]
MLKAQNAMACNPEQKVNTREIRAQFRHAGLFLLYRYNPWC